MTLDERLEQIFDEEFPDVGVVLTDTTTAEDVPGWDSLRHINLVFRIEEAFQIELGPDEVGTLANIGELKSLLRHKGCG